MTNPGPTKEEYDSLIYKLATLESELGQARKLLETPLKRSFWRRLWCWGSKVMVVALVRMFVGVGGVYSQKAAMFYSVFLNGNEMTLEHNIIIN
jgi:hypothetical protein